MPATPGARALCFAYGLSGAFALAYQVVWYHAFVDSLGAASTTFLVVLCAFIGGLGLGAASSSRFFRVLSRLSSDHGLRNYGLVELLLTLSALLLLLLTRLPLAPLSGGFPYHAVTDGGLQLFVPSTASLFLKTGLAAVAVGIPCFLMGTTFPYLCSLFPDDGRFPSRLYGANTLGACVSVLLTEFWGVRHLGYMGCLALAATGTLSLGLFFLRLPATPARARLAPGPSSPPAPAAGPEPTILPGVLSGFLCGGWQALCYVLVKLTLGPTRGVFALLAFFSIAGIWLAASRVHRRPPSRPLLLAAGWAALAWCVGVWLVEPRVSEALVATGSYRLAGVLGVELAALLTTVLAVGLQVFVPYALWSLLLPDLCDRLQARRSDLSWTYGANTLAFLAGVLLFGWALQWVHFFFAARVFLLFAGVGLLFLTVVRWDRPARRGAALAAAALAAAGTAILPRDLEMRLVGGLGEGGRAVEAYRGTPQHLFWVRRGADGSAALMFDRHSMSADGWRANVYMRLMAHFPLLLVPEPKRALLICFGVGSTADAIRLHSGVERVDVVDLNRSVYLLNRHFESSNGAVLRDAKLRLFVDDGRQFVKHAEGPWDLITMEPPPPLQPGISRLYSRQHYAGLKERLSPRGIVSQWLPESQMDARAVALIVATFVDAFPHAVLFAGQNRDLLLAGSREPFDFGGLGARFRREPAVAADLAALGFEGPAHVLATLMRTEATLRPIWGGGELIEDGFASLETIQISPVQQLAPASTFRAPKPGLGFDPVDVGSALARAGAPEAQEVADLQGRLLTDRFFSRVVHPFYVPRPVPTGPR
jgi:spermidine synthase